MANSLRWEQVWLVGGTSRRPEWLKWSDTGLAGDVSTIGKEVEPHGCEDFHSSLGKPEAVAGSRAGQHYLLHICKTSRQLECGEGQGDLWGPVPPSRWRPRVTTAELMNSSQILERRQRGHVSY
jgi:hypothetical protein